MTRPNHALKEDTPPQHLIASREQFVIVSAIEGLQLTSRMTAAFKKFDRDGLSPEDRRIAIRALCAR